MTDSPLDLATLGWGAFFAEPFEPFAARGLIPARVAVEHNYLYRLYSAHGEMLAETSGKLRHQAAGPEALPAVGDWVAIRVRAREGRATIHGVLPRRTCFSRKAAGDPTRQQMVAANIDAVFLVSGLDDEFNLRRIERYLTAAADSGATPVLVLNKADLCDDTEAAERAVEPIASKVPIHVTSSLNGDGLPRLARYLKPGRTLAFLGSSGVGKSTIINRLLGANRQRTHAVRERDSRGRHTTAHRELIVAPGGGLIIDTPGMRELQLWDGGEALRDSFDDIDALAAECHFRDCRHEREPRCAVRQAAADGRLTEARLENYRKLQNEHDSLRRQQDQLADLTERRRGKSIHKLARDFRPRE